MSRRFLQFSLRGFLLATTAFALWLGLVAEKAERQKEAVTLLEEWGATIHYEHEWLGPGKWPNTAATPSGWPWLRGLFGRHYFDKVVSVELVSGNRQLKAAEMALARRGNVPGSLPPPVLTDVHFAALGYLPHLRRLKIIADLNASRAGLRNLEGTQDAPTEQLPWGRRGHSTFMFYIEPPAANHHRVGARCAGQSRRRLQETFPARWIVRCYKTAGAGF